MYPEEQFAMRALKAGADGYLTKAGDPQELLTAFKRILKYISSSLAERLCSHVGSGHKKALDLIILILFSEMDITLFLNIIPNTVYK
jgi:DNA-binding NarL/FixJ family response regulator